MIDETRRFGRVRESFFAVAVFYLNDRIGKSTDTESFFAVAEANRWKIENPNLYFVRICDEQKEISDVEPWDLPKTGDESSHRVGSADPSVRRNEGATRQGNWMGRLQLYQ